MFTRKPKVKPVSATPFSTFIRDASPAEKKRVYTEVIKKASERQNRVLKAAKAASHKDKAK